MWIRKSRLLNMINVNQAKLRWLINNHHSYSRMFRVIERHGESGQLVLDKHENNIKQLRDALIKASEEVLVEKASIMCLQKDVEELWEAIYENKVLVKSIKALVKKEKRVQKPK